MGRCGGEAGPGAHRLLADRHDALLSAVGRRRHLPQSSDAARRRPVSMGEVRLQRAHRISGGLESLGVRDHQHVGNRNSGDSVLCLRHRPRRRPAHQRSRRHRAGERCPLRRAGSPRGARPQRRQMGAQGRRRADARHIRGAARRAVAERRAWIPRGLPPVRAGRTGRLSHEPEPPWEDGLRCIWRLRVRRHSRR